MPDSSNKHTLLPSVTLQRCWPGSVGTVVDGGIVGVVVFGDTVVVDFVAVEVLTPITTLDELCNVLE